jgi:hypothetical protein
MRKPTTRQRLLPFTDENDPERMLPPENRNRCRTLLAQLLLQTIRPEAEERSIDERRKDPNDAP